jgi:superfamily I DNA/RNA helicase
MAKFEYFLSKDVHKQIQLLRKRGGQFTKAANEVTDIIMKINTGHENPFESVNNTHHGESRINHCIKYDLPGFSRLVTIQDNGVCLLAFLGDKGDAEKWLESKKGLNLAIDKKTKQLVPIFLSNDISDPEKRVDSSSDYSEGLLWKKLKPLYFNKIADLIKHSQLEPFLSFDSTMDDEEFLEALTSINDENIQTVFFDVFSLLKKGDIDSAKNRVLAFEEEIKLIQEANKREVASIISDDQFLKITELEAEYLKTILETKGWYDWMLFLHPAQKKIVDEDFSGTSRLLGVSGSGKTCVLVHRAIRLAEKYEGKKILILTLNKSLSKLINKLIQVLLQQTGRERLSGNIRITSFWELCKEYLVKFNNEGIFTNRIFNNKADKHNESVDEIWEEFYTCKLNNDTADVLFPIHQTLLVRGVFPQDYLKQEFDWIRSAFHKDDRNKYLDIDREGRFIPLNTDDRKLILSGLSYWEEKMVNIGVADYLSLASALYKHVDQIIPEYRCALVDEIQDFGTIELSIIRKLVTEDANDLFICGDLAQQVYNKQHKIRSAGINILPEGYMTILKNYRNSREILEAAYSVFSNNVAIEKLKSEDFEILNPEFANFSSPKPFLRAGRSLKNEFESAFEYLKVNLDSLKKEKACIAFCGLTLFTISEFAQDNKLPVLDGEVDLSQGDIFLSDLEQTKGFEFDKMIIINCSKNIFPNPALPQEEWYREISKLYVAMTRAKKELIISFSKQFSSVFDKSSPFFTIDNWTDHIHEIKMEFKLPEEMDAVFEKSIAEKLIGKTFLYQKRAIGMSRELQNKLIDHVAGKSISTGAKKEGWTSIQELRNDVLSGRNKPVLSQLYGPSVFKELVALISDDIMLMKK